MINKLELNCADIRAKIKINEIIDWINGIQATYHLNSQETDTNSGAEIGSPIRDVSRPDVCNHCYDGFFADRIFHEDKCCKCGKVKE